MHAVGNQNEMYSSAAEIFEQYNNAAVCMRGGKIKNKQ